MNTTSMRAHAGATTFIAALIATTMIAITPPASAAVPGLVRVSANSPTDSLDKAVTVTCPAGKKVINAAGLILAANGEVVMDDILPNSALTSVTVTANETDGFTGVWSVAAIAHCAFSPPGLARVTATSASNSLDKSVTATCPAGKNVIGVGGEITGGGGEVIMDVLAPDSTLTSVTVTGNEDTSTFGGSWSILAHAICANPLAGLVRVNAATASNSTDKGITVVCPAGKVVVGSGADINPATGEVVIDDINAGVTSVSMFANEEDPFLSPWTGQVQYTQYAPFRNRLASCCILNRPGLRQSG